MTPSDRATARRLLGLLDGHRRRLVVAAGCGALVHMGGVGLLALSVYLISYAALRPNVLELMVAIVGVRALALVRATARYTERLTTHDVAFRVLADLRVKVYQWIVPHAPLGLRRRDGDLLGRAVGDVESLQALFVTVLLGPLVAMLTSAVAVGVAAVLLPAAAAVLAVGLAVGAIVVPVIAGRWGRTVGRRVTAARGALTTEVVDFVAHAPDLAVNGGLDAAVARLDASDREVVRQETGGAAQRGAASGLLIAVTGATAVGVGVVAVPAVGDGRLAGVALGAVVVLAIAAFEAVAPLAGALHEAGEVLAAGRRLIALADMPLPQPERSAAAAGAVSPAGAVPPAGPVPPAAPVPLAGALAPAASAARPAAPRPARAGGVELTLRGVAIRHPDASAPSLEGIDLDLRPGRRVAVVGASGAGKTTLIAALARFVALDAGSYRLGGAPVTSLEPGEVRRHLAVVEQHPYLFATTIGANLRLACPGATAGDVEAALQQARLSRWVRSLPRGLDTLVGDGGQAVSAGERQRIALARALLSRRPLLLLDEPTASLDAVTGAALLADLLAATRDRGLLLVTHDLRAVGACDEIVVLEAGRVVERGSCPQLLDRDGAFAQMWALDGRRGAAADAA